MAELTKNIQRKCSFLNISQFWFNLIQSFSWVYLPTAGYKIQSRWYVLMLRMLWFVDMRRPVLVCRWYLHQTRPLLWVPANS